MNSLTSNIWEMNNKLNHLFFLIKFVLFIKILKLIKIYRLKYNKKKKGKISDNLRFSFESNLLEECTDCTKVSVLGIDYNLDNIDWHKDIVSQYIYEKKRFDKINYVSNYNRGIEVKNPWELSRFQFFTRFICLYKNSGNKKYYDDFKNLIFKWCDENPYLYGINWTCTMEVSIRAINWIFACLLFDEIFYNDNEFKDFIKGRLIEHANYIYMFPEKSLSGKSNNHLASNYCGLLVISNFIDSKDSKKWKKNAIRGLEDYMKNNIYDDGCDFECSIPYHRLVLEMFIIAAFLDKERTLFSKEYYFKLFKMLEFVECYTDSNGNAPQMGDNDSGVILPFNKLDNQNHLYLLLLGKYIFKHDFLKNKNKATSELNIYPLNQKKFILSHFNLRDTNSGIFYKKGGYYILQNKKYKIVIYAPQKENVAGHRHYDAGNYTISCNGEPLIVDPGTGCYTSDLYIRNKLRSHFSHNVYFDDVNIDNNKSFFSKVNNDYCEIIDIGDNYVKIVVKNSLVHFFRTFQLYNDKVVITDCFKSLTGNIKGGINIFKNFILNGKIIQIGNDKICLNENCDLDVNNFLYSNMYGQVIELKRIEYIPQLNNTIVIS